MFTYFYQGLSFSPGQFVMLFKTIKLQQQLDNNKFYGTSVADTF
jgi:hypothetical protein